MEAFMYRCHPQIARVLEIIGSGEDWLSFGANRRRRFGAYSWLDLRFYTLEDWLNFDANRQRHLRVCGDRKSVV